MASETDVKREFLYLGIALDDSDVIAKCLELCTVHRITAETLVEQWTAFSVSRLNGAGHPTVDRLQKLERDYLTKVSSATAAVQTSSPSLQRKSVSSTGTPSRLRAKFINESLTNDLSILEEYSTGDLTAQLNKSVISNRSMDTVTIVDDLDETIEQVPGSDLAFKVVLVLNKASEDEQGWPMVGEQQQQRQRARLNVRFESGKKKAEFMHRYDFSVKQKQCERTDRLARAIIARFGFDDIFTFIEISSEKIVTYGRVIREDSLSKEIYLEGSADFAPGQEAQLDLSQLAANQHPLFSGQIVVLESICMDRNILIPQRIYSDASLPLAQWPLLRDDRAVDTETIQFAVVSGPFAVFDYNSTDGPLVLQLQCYRKMLRVVQQLKPHVLIVLGPFFEHETATRHAPVLGLSSLDELYQQLLELMYQQLQSLNIEIFIVPSNQDSHHVNVYPTPAYRKYTSTGTANVHFLPNPCIFHVDSLAIGISTFDILFEMNKYEIVAKDHKPVDKIALFVRHLIEQQSFYPIYPDLTQFSDRADLEDDRGGEQQLLFPPTNNVDSVLVDRMCHFNGFTPHVLILPSQFVHFAKIVNETLALNPGKCCRKTSGSGTNSGGSLARFRFEPNCESVNDSVRCQIIRF